MRRRSHANLSIRPEQPPNILPTELRSDVSLIFDAVGPVDEVTLPSFSAGAELETTRLGVEEAAKALPNQTMNMQRIREAGPHAPQ